MESKEFRPRWANTSIQKCKAISEILMELGENGSMPGNYVETVVSRKAGDLLDYAETIMHNQEFWDQHDAQNKETLKQELLELLEESR